MSSRSTRSWMLDPIEFHHDFERRLRGPDGLVSVRDRALYVWDTADPTIRSYLELLPITGPDDWFRSCDEDNLVEWYRVLMGPWLTPTRTFASSDALRRALPELGWHATDARRLARGREFVTLAERHLSAETLDRLLLRFGWGIKGWLDNDDVVAALDRMRNLERSIFRSRPDLVPVVEDAFHVFETAAAKPDHVLVTLAD